MSKLSVVKRKDFEKFLLYVGCEKKRQKGSHIIYTKTGLDRPLVIVDDKELSFRVVRSCLKTLNLTIEQYLEIMEKV
jgi:predicted RNA binding protein YcfA (HicA-like mRNA interferase family)